MFQYAYTCIRIGCRQVAHPSMKRTPSTVAAGLQTVRPCESASSSDAVRSKNAPSRTACSTSPQTQPEPSATYSGNLHSISLLSPTIHTRHHSQPTTSLHTRCKHGERIHAQLPFHQHDIPRPILTLLPYLYSTGIVRSTLPTASISSSCETSLLSPSSEYTIIAVASFAGVCVTSKPAVASEGARISTASPLSEQNASIA